MSRCPVPPPAFDTVYHAAPGHLDALLDELEYRGTPVDAVRDPLVLARGRGQPAAWACNTWTTPRLITIDSIGDAARTLRALARNWHVVSIDHHRRTQLIADRLPRVSGRPLVFPVLPPSAPLGAWTLQDRATLIASTDCTSVFAAGRPAFVENREDPPNRAYLKLWEALTLARRWPQLGQTCLDLGAAPGGWSWVLAACGARVIAIDRADLAPTITSHPAIESRRGDVFKLGAGDVPTPDWIVSDVIAYPERLLDLARYWAKACPDAGMILTIKFQGRVDPGIVAEFMAIAGSRVAHLWANKHELTWFRLPDGGPPEATGLRKNP